jgi:CubicO group peptidase (beta-lactamase class C family)
MLYSRINDRFLYLKDLKMDLLSRHKIYRLLLTIGLLLSFAIFPVLAQEATTYSDPAGLFTVEIPNGWTDTSTDAYGLFAAENGAEIYLLSAGGDDIETGINAVLAEVAPELADANPIQSTELPAPNGIWTQNIYTVGSDLALIIAQVKDGTTYAMFVPATSIANLQAITPDINTMLLAFTIGEALDLTSVQPTALTADMLDDLEVHVSDLMGQYHITGASMAIVQNGEIIYTHGFGTLGLDDDQPVTSDTLFMIGSTTKSMTTLMMASLVDEGLLDWDTPVIDILPDFALSDPAATPQIRVRDLVNNSSGVPRYDIPLILEYLSPEEGIDWLKDIPLVSEPGEEFHYSNLMVSAGGWVAALAAGAEYDQNVEDTYFQLIQERVFDPIGMTNSTFDMDDALAEENHASPVTFNFQTNEFEAVPIDYERFVTSVAPAGAVWSNAEDMVRYMLMQLNRGVALDGTRVVSEKNLLETQTINISTGAGSYGMGWFIDQYHGLKQISHGGNTSDFTSEFTFLPDADLGVLVLMNRSLGNNFGASIREYVFEQAFGLEHESDKRYLLAENQLNNILTAVIGSIETVDITEDAASDYLGSYEHSVDVSYSDGALIVKTELIEMQILWSGEEGRFFGGTGGEGVEIHFEENEDGTMSVTVGSLLSAVTGEVAPPLMLKKLI